MTENQYVVYKHTSPSGKCYIGITKQEPNRRWNYGNGYIRCPVFYKAIQKYSWNNINHEILDDNLSFDEANKKEQEYIQIYNSKVPYGYNITDGGDGSPGIKLSEDRISKISKKHCKRVVRFNAETLDFEIYNSMKEAEEKTGSLKEAISACCRNKLYTAYNDIWMYYDIYAKNNRNDLIQICIDRIENGKPAAYNHREVCQYSKKGVFIKNFDSITTAAKTFGVTPAAIRSCCVGTSKTSKGFIWKYKEDNINIDDHKSKIVKTICKIHNNKIIKFYSSLTDAANNESINIKKLSKYTLKNFNECENYLIDGYKWMYYDDYKNLKERGIV